MIKKRIPIPVNEAVKKVMQYAKTGEAEEISFMEADGRHLAVPLTAEHDVPSFAKSPYDGFAFDSRFTHSASSENPVTFEVVERIGAGQLPQKKLRDHEAARIMTGAMIPDGADCVAMFEVCHDYEENDKHFMKIKRRMEAGQNVMPAGSEVQKGQVLLDAGTHINPGVKALLATFGCSTVKVAKKPVIGILATGTELLDVDEPLQPGKIRNSNGYMIASQVTRAGGTYKDLGKLPDHLETSFEKIKDALNEVDILITTGGVSVGDFDLMPEIYKRLGAEVLFNKIAMRPGSVTTAARKGNQLLFGLSGNPAACYVGFELFVRPVIQRALFKKNCYLRQAPAILGEDFPKPNPFTRFVRSRIEYHEDGLHVFPSGMDKSNAVSSLALADGLMVLPGGTRGFRKGGRTNVLLLEDRQGQNTFLL